MISIDKLSYISPLKKVNPFDKFVFAFASMFLCLILNKILISLIVITLMTSITVYKGKILLNTYLKLMLLPSAFLITGILSIAMNIGNNDNYLFYFSILNLKIGCTQESLLFSLRLLLKSLSSVSCLYFLSLTTPIIDILSVLKKLKVPKIFVELMSLIYRFIFVLLETAHMIYIAQNSRLGYIDLKTSYSSLAKLISALFINSYKRSEDIFIALVSRCYDNEINILEDTHEKSYKNLIIITLFELLLILISFYLNI